MGYLKRVGIAVVEHAGRFLIGIRGPDVPLAGLSEFPGGKCEEEEAPADCAVRECLEETGLSVFVSQCLMTREFQYPHAHIELHFFLCHPTEVASVKDEHRGFQWLDRTSLSSLNFPEANAPLVELLLRTDLTLRSE